MNQISSNKEITIIVVTWNSREFLFPLFESFKKQSFKNYQVIVVDNNSSDGTIEFIKESYPQFQVLKNNGNAGFAKANNQAIKLADSPFVLICNPDIILEPEFLSEALKTARGNDKIGSVGGKLLRLKGSLKEQADSDTIDSTGILFFKSRRAVDRGENEQDIGQYDNLEEVFGISGALALYNKSALEKIAVDDEYFDEDFFAYKEDVDLAWRLRLAGYQSIYNPAARAYHCRSIARKTDLSDKGTVINRASKTARANYLSYRNHLWMLIKNDGWTGLFLHPAIGWYEFKKLIYLIFKEPAIIKALPDFWKKIPKMIQKRKKIKLMKLAKNNNLTKWFK
ncbi:MAG: hypothetical protein COY66_06600 [Candidatus Kerfeldbacteria bacterium CG_4_10_14_0_8_um_filter_42_10]|uniref:Glycosyltransferase 2-like domain-containing protein n=1 Tax=Candidatus Kerfeldbacteria bacterium CG_4_10_14_0_8_um_filter_42_10 TaxID=2014248 RepID=A0A2M7RGM9_9BACT|nr:MAG: hypothetical protein COY66_06600 [Candidatus Kerfeldbacteria bacterium CG_4_10_14_0_8_um_filter_42_10]